MCPRFTEVDEQSRHGDLDRHGNECGPSVCVGISEDDGNDDGEGTGDNAEDVYDVARACYGEVEDDLEIRAVEHLVRASEMLVSTTWERFGLWKRLGLLESDPAIEAEHACSHNRSIFHEVEWEERLWRKVILPDTKSHEEEYTNNDHACKCWRSPALFQCRSKTEGQKEAAKSCTYEYQADNYER